MTDTNGCLTRLVSEEMPESQPLGMLCYAGTIAEDAESSKAMSQK